MNAGRAVPSRAGLAHHNLPCQHGLAVSARLEIIVCTVCRPSQADGHACSLDTKMAWSEHETLYLFELWGEDSIQVQIEGCARNREVYVKLVEQMKEEGYSRTCVQLEIYSLLFHQLINCIYYLIDIQIYLLVT